ncbi:MAG: nucleotidyltransferase domain-containing protein [Methylobacter sp.]|nr:nucleotidyltransferase domain-containing protein [Methylobacter sp.]MDP2099261.1 nucleotidyltransferase domain-containing protein [Methylobacter sp.]MDP2429550.1 nucleotidyltransferase domain-containing protein [Methylobacter sp.]MDP3056769.1 nucleotidyltransferase domain-containing protein [Methylobacter sp.]MDP3360666.1 nucleotidyltransferase domain-containing protein [Methylobacter sp.]
MFGLNEPTLAHIKHALQHYPDIEWVKMYSSRAKGNYQRGSDIDLAFSCVVDHSGALMEELDNLPTPYLFDVTHYETLKNQALKEHIDRVGVVIFEREVL